MSTDSRELPGAEIPSDGGGGAPTASTLRTDGVAVRRVRKAYEQVASQLRELIISGNLTPGDRLPNEASLAKDFGVSRTTVREALRTLAAHGLIYTTKGPTGGNFVARVEIESIAESLVANLRVLTDAGRISLDELLEAREFLEVGAARMAAVRSSQDAIERLRATLPEEITIGPQERLKVNVGFHTLLMSVAGNGLLYLSALPILAVLQQDLARSDLTTSWHEQVHRDHAEIITAIEDADPDSAGSLMKGHLDFLRPAYERVWISVLNRTVTEVDKLG